MANGEDRKGKASGSHDLENRLRTLDDALERHREERRVQPEGDGRSATAAGFANALRLSSEFVAGIVVGAGLGWLIDRAFGTSPWGLIVFLLLGFVAGVLNVLRSAGLVAQRGGLNTHPSVNATDRDRNGPN
jgi:ATP synthase protein I